MEPDGILEELPPDECAELEGTGIELRWNFGNYVFTEREGSEVRIDGNLSFSRGVDFGCELILH